MAMEDVFKLIAQMSADQQENMMKFAAELKKPTAREQAEIDRKEAEIKRRQEERLKLAKAEEDRKKNMALGCVHATYHPGTGVTRHAWRTQVNSDGYFRPTCQICQTQLPRIKATPDMLLNGVNLDQYMGLDADKLRKWAEQAEVA